MRAESGRYLQETCAKVVPMSIFEIDEEREWNKIND